MASELWHRSEMTRNIPLVTRLKGVGVSTGTLVGNEEAIDDYGMRVWLEWARNAVVTTKAEKQKDFLARTGRTIHFLQRLPS
jgi:hypothetical protein